MYELYFAPGAASFAVHWMLIELGAEHRLTRVDLDAGAQKRPDYLKLNPAGVVPTLVVDGAPYGEAAALLLLLAEKHPKAGLAPPPDAPERAAFLQWMFYLANTLQPAFRLWFYPEEGAGAANVEATKAQSRKRIETVWARIDDHLADGRRFMLGEKMSAVDFLATMLMRWSRNMPEPAQTFLRIDAYLKRMKTMASLRETHVREGLTDWIDA